MTISPVRGFELGGMLCERLGLPTNLVHSITLHFEVDELPQVTVGMYLTEGAAQILDLEFRDFVLVDRVDT